MLWLAAATLAIGLTLLILGLRGRLIDDHPICRKCKFDLIGLPTNPERERAGRALPTENAASPPRCPECGKDLWARRAIQTGARRRLPAVIALGVLISVFGAGAASFLFWSAATGFNWHRLKPDWLITRDLMRPHRIPDERILEVAEQRLAAGSFGGPSSRRLIDYAIAAQAPRRSRPIERLKDLVEAARTGKLITPEQWNKYAEQMLPRIIMVAPEPSEWRGESLRLSGDGSNGPRRTAITRKLMLVSLVFGENEVAADSLGPAWEINMGWPGAGPWSISTGPLGLGLSPSHIPTETRWKLQVIDRGGVVLVESERTLKVTPAPATSGR